MTVFSSNLHFAEIYTISLLAFDKFYKDLDPSLKKQYREIYMKEIKRLRREQCLAPAGTAALIVVTLIIISGG